MFDGKPYKEVLGRSSDLVGTVSQALVDQSDVPRTSVTLTDQYGEKRTLSAWVVWVQEEDNSPVGLVLTVFDDSRLESFSSGIEGAERASSLRHVATGIVHEVRNPLTPIRGLAQILASGKQISPEKLQSYAKVIVDAVDRVNRVVDRFAMLSKPPEEDFAITDLREILASMEDAVSHLANKARVSVQVEMEDPDLEIPCQPKLLVRALTNLVINGIEASPSNSVVKVGSKAMDGQVVIDVSNLGSSIPPSELDDLFLPFHTSKKNGTGLGIPISDSIVKSHGGSLSVKSSANQTTFSISIPLQVKGLDGMPIPIKQEDSERAEVSVTG